MRPVTEAGKANCIPVAMPFVDSLFMPRTIGDRPDVIHDSAHNPRYLLAALKAISR